jgi:hypothetical protein
VLPQWNQPGPTTSKIPTKPIVSLPNLPEEIAERPPPQFEAIAAEEEEEENEKRVK